jgi:hypothetical protein
VVDRLVNAVVETPGGGVGDLFCALFGLLRDYSPDLTTPVAGLLRETVVRCFTRHRASYDSVDWQELVKGVGDNATKAQLYLALHAIPPEFLPSQLADAIIRGLESTAYREEAVSALAL